MSISDLGAIGELLGSLVVAVTVLVLIYQIRQNTLALEASSEAELSSNFARFHGRMADRPELIEIFDKAQADPKQLSPLEVARYQWWVAEIFYMAESAHKRFQRGQLTDATWQTFLGSILGHLENEIIREWWEAEASPFPPNFREDVEEARSSIEVGAHKIHQGKSGIYGGT